MIIFYIYIEGSQLSLLKADGRSCKVCHDSVDACACEYIVKTMDVVNKKLGEMELLDCLVGQRITDIVQKNICYNVSFFSIGPVRNNVDRLLKVYFILILFSFYYIF